MYIYFPLIYVPLLFVLGEIYFFSAKRLRRRLSVYITICFVPDSIFCVYLDDKCNIGIQYSES